MVKLPKIKVPRLKFPSVKFKGVGKKKLLIIGGVAFLSVGVGVGGWLFMPDLGLTRYALSVAGLSHAESQASSQAASPHSQNEHGDALAAKDQIPASFSAQSQLVLAVRAMLSQQSELAMGKAGAGSRLKASMSIIATMTQNMDVRTLTTQEYDAAAVYVLSGGRPEILERIAAEDRLDPERQALFEGAVSFVRGDMKVAAAKLAPIDPAKFEPVLAARIHMLQAHLEEKAPYEVRRKSLETAANTTLGTLLEEAATRRMVALAGENGALKDFFYWSDRYQRRFPYSPYFPDFWADVMKTVFLTEKSSQPLGLKELHDLLLHVPEDRKLTFVRTLILRSIKEGYPRLCQFGLDEATETSGRSGVVVEKMSRRKGELRDLRPSGGGKVRLTFNIPSRGLIGYHGEFLTDTRGTGIMNRLFAGYGPWKGTIEGRRNGSLISTEGGETVHYALWYIQERGTLFVNPGEKIYQGMILGEHSRGSDLEVNPIKEKKLTNVRAAGKDDAMILIPPRRMSLEQAIAYVEDDELVEVTPSAIRLRKRYLDPNERKRFERSSAAQREAS